MPLQRWAIGWQPKKQVNEAIQSDVPLFRADKAVVLLVMLTTSHIRGAAKA